MRDGDVHVEVVHIPEVGTIAEATTADGRRFYGTGGPITSEATRDWDEALPSVHAWLSAKLAIALDEQHP